MSYLTNNHQLFKRGAVNGELFRWLESTLVAHNKPSDVEDIRDWIWRMGPYVVNPNRVVRDREHAEQLISGTAPPLAEVFLGRWQENFLYGDYAKWAYAHFRTSRRRDAFAWNVSRGLTHIVSGAAEMDHWGADRGHPEWTIRRFRWWESEANRNKMLASLVETREFGLLPILTVFEHTSIPLDVNTAIARAQQLVNLTWKHVPLYILSWEIDERYNNSQERLDWEVALLSGVDWRGRDVGIHYSQIKRLEGSGFDVSNAWNDAYPGHVVKLYQSRRSAPESELLHETALLTDVAAETGIKLAAFEHSGLDPGIGNVYPEDISNRRAQVCIDQIKQKLSPDRTGSMNGRVTL